MTGEQIMGNNESTEPFTTNMYNRRVLAGEFTVVNKVSLPSPLLSSRHRSLSLLVPAEGPGGGRVLDP